MYECVKTVICRDLRGLCRNARMNLCWQLGHRKHQGAFPHLLIQRYHVGSLKSSVGRVFTPQKLASASEIFPPFTSTLPNIEKSFK